MHSVIRELHAEMPEEFALTHFWHQQSDHEIEYLHFHNYLERIAPSLKYMNEHFSEEIRVADLARACHVSVNHYRRLFRSATGQLPMEYLTRLRLQMAVALLQSTDRTILDIAMDVGFRSLSTFNRQFRRVFNATPRSLR